MENKGLKHILRELGESPFVGYDFLHELLMSVDHNELNKKHYYHNGMYVFTYNTDNGNIGGLPGIWTRIRSSYSLDRVEVLQYIKELNNINE
jgi:hypothetical protein